MIFLDIDGVINLEHGWCQSSIRVLNSITHELSASIIVSSDWKHEYSFDKLISILEKAGVKGEIVGVTVDVKSRNALFLERDRAEEIIQTISSLGIKEFLVLDDLSLTDYF